MKFLADRMLGRLATWLRIFGFDTVYERQIEDKEIIFRVIKEKRILLTRDTLLAKRRELKDSVFFISSDHFREQVAEVLSVYTPILPRFSRCLRCNEPVKVIPRESIRQDVPAYVYETVDEFSRCPFCKRIFWKATHVEHAKREIETILSKLKKE
jgi:uncharacterized protein with PIN domain